MRANKLPLILALAGLPTWAGAEPVVEQLHGYRVVDSHRHLESDEGAADWIAGQHQATAKYFEKLAATRAPMASRLDELSKVGGVSGVKVVGDRTFYAKRTGDQEQSVLYVRDAKGRERPLVDPAKLDPSGKTALDWYYPSDSGKKLAYGLSKDGSEDSVLHILDVDTGKLLPDRIPHTRHGSIAWLPDESAFYYTRYPADDRYNRRVYFHRIGGDPAADEYVFGKELARTDWVNVKLSADGSKVFFDVSKGWSVSALWMMERGKGEPKEVLSHELGALFGDVRWIDGRIVVLTNHGAPKFKLVSVDPAKPAPSEWKTLIPEGEWPIEGTAFVNGQFAVSRLVKAVSHLELYEKDGKLLGEVALPGVGAVVGLDGEAKGKRLAVAYASFLEPTGVYEVKLPGRKLQPLATVKAPDVSKIVVEQVEYPSYDGTLVPMFIVKRADVKLEGKNPTLLTGYGGFNVSITPRFSPSALYWVERGGVYAVANIRGGSEMGEAWHDAGRLDRKHQVYRDFEFAMRHLIRTGYTRPESLAITGGSNGGLLMGAMMTQAPELFRAAIGRVGLYDMIRFHQWPPAELWVDEYGSADNAEQVGYLLGYSPYHQVLPGVKYPSFLGLTAKSDTRVTWIHTAKFVAALQEATGGTAPILFHMEEKAGHGQGKGRSDRVQEEVMMFQFLEAELAPADAGISAPAAAR